MEETNVEYGDEVRLTDAANCRHRRFTRRASIGDRMTVHRVHLPTMAGEKTLVSLRPHGMSNDKDYEEWPAYTYCTVDLSDIMLVGKAPVSDDFDWKAAEEAVRHFESLGEWRGKDRRSDPAGDVVLRESLGEINDREDAKHAAVLRRLHDKAKALAGRK